MSPPAQKITVISHDIPVILCTGNSEHIKEERSERIGIGEFAMKPFVVRLFAATIRNVPDVGSYLSPHDDNFGTRSIDHMAFYRL